jgi:Amt family ammonium transporter
MTINGCLAGLVGITGSCAYVSVLSSLIIGALAGVLVVFAVIWFDKRKIDDPVGATSVHLACGVFGTICVGLFAEEGITSVSPASGLFFGGGFTLLGVELLGIIAVGAFVFCASVLVWLILKKTSGIRVTLSEEIEGLDVGEHGNQAYPDFVIASPILNPGDDVEVTAEAAALPSKPAASVDEAVTVTNAARKGAKLTRVTVITNQSKFEQLRESLESIGITGMTVTNVLGFGMQHGNTRSYYRGAPVETRLLPKVKVDVVISKIPTDLMVSTVKRTLYTGNIGDGKIFIYDVENVVKVSSGEEGYDALQDVAD